MKLWDWLFPKKKELSYLYINGIKTNIRLDDITDIKSISIDDVSYQVSITNELKVNVKKNENSKS
jgi:hypothetical protein